MSCFCFFCFFFLFLFFCRFVDFLIILTREHHNNIVFVPWSSLCIKFCVASGVVNVIHVYLGDSNYLKVTLQEI